MCSSVFAIHRPSRVRSPTEEAKQSLWDTDAIRYVAMARKHLEVSSSNCIYLLSDRQQAESKDSGRALKREKNL